MSVPLVIGGETFQQPTRREKGWADRVVAIQVALAEALANVAEAGGGADLQSLGIYTLTGGGTHETINEALAAMRTAGMSQLLVEGTYVFDCGGLSDSSALVTVRAGERILGLGYGRSVISIINTTQGAGEFGVFAFEVEVGGDYAAIKGFHWRGDNGAPDGTGFTYVLNNLNACINVKISIVTPTRHLDFSDNYFECLWGFSILDAQGLAFDDGGNAFIRAVGNTYRYCANGVNINGSFNNLDGDFYMSEGYECSGASNHLRARMKDMLGVGVTVGGFQDASANFPGTIVDVTIDGCTGAGITITDGAHGTQVNAFVRHCDDAGLIINGTVAPPRGAVIRGVFVSNCKDPGSNLNGIYLNAGSGHQLNSVQSYDNGDAGFAQAYGLNVVGCPDVQVWGGFFGGSAHDISVGNGSTNFRTAGVELENNSIEFIGTSSVGYESLSGKAGTDLLWTTRENSGSYLAERSAHAVDSRGKHYFGNGIDLHDATFERSGAGEFTFGGALVVPDGVTADLAGNADTATVATLAAAASVLATPRNIAGVAFDGSGNINVPFSGLTGGIDDTQHGNRGGGSLHAAAGGGSSGFMTDAQATKLAGIASGATAEVDADATHAGRVSLGNQQLGTGVKGVEAVELLDNTPAAPGAGKVRLFAKTRARPLPYWRTPSGDYGALQPLIGGKRVVSVRANASGLTGIGTAADAVGTALTSTGTISSPAPATTNILTASPRMVATAAVATPTACEFRENTVLRYWRGNASGLGGFYFICRFGLSVISANRRWMCGLGAATGTYAAANDPSAATNILWVGQDTADTNIQFMHNDGSGTATKNAGSSNVAVPTTSEVMEFHMYAPPNGSAVEMYLEKVNGGGSTSYSASSDLPASTQLLMFHFWNGSGAGLNTQVAVDLISLYIETDF